MARKPQAKGTSSNTVNDVKMNGKLVWWKFQPFQCDREKFEKMMSRLGDLHVQPVKKAYRSRALTDPLTYLDLLPKNSYKNALLRALRALLKGDDRFYKRLRDVAESVSLPVIIPVEIFERQTLADIQYEREVVINLNKKTGELSFNCKTPFNKMVQERYDEMRSSFDSEQLSNVLINIVKTQCYGVSIKLGVYYVPDEHQDQLAILEQICDWFKQYEIELFQIPVYNDKSSKRAVQAAIEEDLADRLEGMKEEYAKLVRAGKLSRELRENRLADMNSLIDRIRIYRSDLSSQVKVIDTRVKEFQTVVTKCNKFSEELQKDEGFLDALLRC